MVAGRGKGLAKEENEIARPACGGAKASAQTEYLFENLHNMSIFTQRLSNLPLTEWSTFQVVSTQKRLMKFFLPPLSSANWLLLVPTQTFFTQTSTRRSHHNMQIFNHAWKLFNHVWKLFNHANSLTMHSDIVYPFSRMETL
jgi:hypothetical protein